VQLLRKAGIAANEHASDKEKRLSPDIERRRS